MQLIVALFIAIILYWVQHRLYKRIWNRNLDVDITFDDNCIEVGSTSGITEVISNAKLLPLPVFHVKFSTDRSFQFIDQENSSVTDCYHRNDVFSVMGHEKVTRRLKFRANKRGLYDIKRINIITRDFFLTGNIASSIKQNTYMYVLPAKLYTTETQILFNKMLGELTSRKSMLEDPYTFRGIREYDTTDSMRKINWKASARTDNLMVNMNDYTSEAKVCILYNMETNMMLKPAKLQEIGIEMASAITDFFISHSIPVMIEGNGTDILSGECEKVDYGASSGHAITIYKYLARINENAGIDKYMELVNERIKLLDKNTTYIFISPYYKEDLIVKLDYMKSNGLDIHMLVPYYDIQPINVNRDYIHGWEVRMNETET